MILKRDPSLLLQLGFLALLLVSTVQVGWWMYDHVSKARDVESRFAAEYQHEAGAVTAFFSGTSTAEIAEHLPAVALSAHGASVRPEALASADASPDRVAHWSARLARVRQDQDS